MIKGSYGPAVEDLTRSIELNHERGVAFLARGLYLSELDRMEDAARDLMKTAITFSPIEIEKFANMFGEDPTLFDKSIALLEGEWGQWKIVLDEGEVNKLKKGGNSFYGCITRKGCRILSAAFSLGGWGPCWVCHIR